MCSAAGLPIGRVLGGVVLLLAAVLGALAVVGVGPARAEQEVVLWVPGLWVPGPSQPVGPTDVDAMTDVREELQLSDGKLHLLEDVRLLRGVRVEGTGTKLVIRNCVVVNPGSFWTVYVTDGAALEMEDCQIGDDSGPPGERGVGGNNVTLRRVKVVGHTDGIKSGDDGLYEQVWVTDLRDAGPGHMDALQDDGGGGGWTLRHSRMEAITLDGVLGNAAVFIKSDLGAVSDVVLDGNILDGGNYTVYSSDGGSGPPTEIVVQNNAFGRQHRYGILSTDGEVAWENNTWEDTGELIDESGQVVGAGPTGTTVPPESSPSESSPSESSPSETTPSETTPSETTQPEQVAGAPSEEPITKGPVTTIAPESSSSRTVAADDGRATVRSGAGRWPQAVIVLGSTAFVLGLVVFAIRRRA